MVTYTVSEYYGCGLLCACHLICHMICHVTLMVCHLTLIAVGPGVQGRGAGGWVTGWPHLSPHPNTDTPAGGGRGKEGLDTV